MSRSNIILDYLCRFNLNLNITCCLFINHVINFLMTRAELKGDSHPGSRSMLSSFVPREVKFTFSNKRPACGQWPEDTHRQDVCVKALWGITQFSPYANISVGQTGNFIPCLTVCALIVIFIMLILLKYLKSEMFLLLVTR